MQCQKEMKKLLNTRVEQKKIKFVLEIRNSAKNSSFGREKTFCEVWKIFVNV